MNSTGYNLLIVDEDRFVANILRQTLQNDFTLTSVTNGIEAISWLENGNKTDFIITELSMAHLDGRELIRILRSSNLFNHIPIIVLSELEDSSTRIECLEYGADDYVAKPFNPIEVKAKARAILRRVQLQTQAAYQPRYVS
ncbi:response regulator transcription factor [Spirosoma validum]|uniref:Response regulator transcription factor n=1 Tax=Spirosoma validum TaxID=2771355 RepID=A0A927GFV9_9BACT|nr:response regulator [Spirosoma validum]MBD2756234.1 response regulator transcription factor [Spirosoma validum]